MSWLYSNSVDPDYLELDISALKSVVQGSFFSRNDDGGSKFSDIFVRAEKPACESIVILNIFGACLMAEPETVAACVAAMKAATDLPIAVKSRIGIDDLDSYEHLVAFTETVKKEGCKKFIIHACKIWLTGLSTEQYHRWVMSGSTS